MSASPKAERQGGHDDDFDDFIEDDLGAEPEVATSRRGGFHAWRRSRPFWPGLLVILSGLIILAPAYLTVRVSDLLVMISTISGVSTLLIGALLIMFGLGMWLQPEAKAYLGVLSILVAIISLPTSNIGGFVVGALTGLIGGCLALGWERGERGERKPGRLTPATGSTRVIVGGELKAVLAVVGSVAVVALSVGEARTVYAQEPAPEPPPAPAPAPASAPVLPGLPELRLPELPPLPLPPPGQPILPPPHLPIPDHLTIPGVGDVVTPATEQVPPPGAPTPAGGVSVVTADNVTLTGNVHVTLEDIPVAGTVQRAIVLSGDRLVAKNLALQIPGTFARGTLSTGPVTTTVSNGPVRVIATALTATPAVADVNTIPVTIDITGGVGAVLDQLGLPNPNPVPQVNVPDVVMDEIALRNVTLHMVSLYGMNFDAPAVSLTAHR